MDTFADFLTRVRNGLRSRQRDVRVPYSRLKYEVARVLLEEGFITNFSVEGDGPQRQIVVTLKYDDTGKSVIRGIRLVSRQSRRVYVGVSEIPRVIGGLGVAILTTPQGIVTDREARRKGVGGEVLCKVW